jgi:UDP-N-acetylmuramate-alanine ligase
VNAVLEQVREQDAILTLGAGNVWQAGDRILEKLREAG